MRTRLLRAPWWVLALVAGVPFAAIMAVTGLLDGGSVVGTVVGAVGSGVFFGVFMGAFLARTNRRTRAAVGDLPPDRETAVHRSARRGPIPDDPEERAAAARLVAHELDQTQRNLWWSLVVTVGFLLLSVWLAVSSSDWWWWLAAAFWCAFMGGSVWLPSHLRQRLAVLRQASEA